MRYDSYVFYSLRCSVISGNKCRVRPGALSIARSVILHSANYPPFRSLLPQISFRKLLSAFCISTNYQHPRFEIKRFEMVIWNWFFELWFWFEIILNHLILILTLTSHQLFGDFYDFKSSWKTKIIWRSCLFFSRLERYAAQMTPPTHLATLLLPAKNTTGELVTVR